MMHGQQNVKNKNSAILTYVHLPPTLSGCTKRQRR